MQIVSQYDFKARAEIYPCTRIKFKDERRVLLRKKFTWRKNLRLSRRSTFSQHFPFSYQQQRNFFKKMFARVQMLKEEVVGTWKIDLKSNVLCWRALEDSVGTHLDGKWCRRNILMDRDNEEKIRLPLVELSALGDTNFAVQWPALTTTSIETQKAH